MNKLKLGIEAKDTVTGFKGTVTGRCSYLTGCDQILISPPVDKEGKHVESRWYDVNRVVGLTEKPIVLDTQTNKGACKPAPTC